MKSGFTLLEILIATAISSLLMTILFFSYNQMNNVVRYVTDYTDIFDSAILVEQQITKDIAGAFIPVQAIEPKAKGQKEASTDEQQQQLEPEKKEQKRAVLKDPFVSKNVGKNMSMLSFITANPMRVYWGKKTGEPKPSIARVVYTLQEDKNSPKNQPRFSLYRQEGKGLELAPYTKKESSIERYLIAENIESCTLSFFVTVEKESEQEVSGKSQNNKDTSEVKKQKKEKEVEIKTFDDWHINEDKKDARSKSKLPDIVSMEITLADEVGRRNRTFKFAVGVAAKFTEIPEPKDQNEKEEKKPGPQPSKQQAKKEVLVTGANSVVQNIRAMFRT
ncbi:MAG: prepilin-type N-terminal cleavage/methylation domain-containing protein [Candidatus Dependentiae bacterium]